MWHAPDKYKKSLVDLNNELYQLEGTLPDHIAQVSLAKFLRHNISYTTYLASGVQLAPYQEIILKAFFNRNFSLCVWGRGCGKSLYVSDDQLLISKEHGMISTQAICKDMDFTRGERWVDIPSLYLWNGQGWRHTNKLLLQPQKSCYRLTTTRGYTLEGSTNHKIKVLDQKTCRIVWKHYHELTTNDYVCISRNIIEYNTNNQQDALNEAYLIGLLVGDGSFVSPNIRITSADQEILDFCQAYTDLEVRPTASQAQELSLSVCFSNYLRDKYQLAFHKSYHKEIPQLILSSSSLLRQFLSGLFDTDAGVEFHRTSIVYSTVSEKLAQAAHIALLTFGIISKLYIRKTASQFGKAWVIEISGINARLFFQNIGFKLKRKAQYEQKFNTKKTNTNIDVIPGALQYVNDIKRNNRLYKDNSTQWRNKIRRKSQDELSYQSLKQSLDFFAQTNIPSHQYQNLTDIYNEYFFFDQITSMQSTTHDCVDFNIPQDEYYWSNGFISHNSFIAAVYCILQCIFEPNTKILVAGPTFRTSRFIFENIEKIVESKEAAILFQAFGAKTRRNDLFEWKINGGSIKAIPLNGEKIRGFRANILVLDEFLLLPEEIVKNVLMPFLTAPQNISERLRVRKIEDSLIDRGLMHEEDRISFASNTKMIALSSASYTFENLYRVYTDWINKIYVAAGKEYEGQPEVDISVKKSTYFVSQLSYEALPDDLIDRTIIQEAQSSTGDASFDREYRAVFTDGSASYFSAEKMAACTYKIGENPSIQLVGHNNAKYILSIDPSFSSSPTSDFFSMSVFLLNETDNTTILVHNYAIAGGDLIDHIKYFCYLVLHFNIVLIIADNADGNFLDSVNESQMFKNLKVEPYTFFDFDSELEGQAYVTELRKARKAYNLENHTICVKQVFSKNFIRRANEFLQTNIDRGKLKFASNINGNDLMMDNYFALDRAKKIQYQTFTSHNNILDFIDTQDSNIYGTKAECALIEVRTDAQGNQTFDLPLSLKRNTSPNRPRRDRYTTLLLGNWATRSYFDIMSCEEQEEQPALMPFFIY